MITNGHGERWCSSLVVESGVLSHLEKGKADVGGGMSPSEKGSDVGGEGMSPSEKSSDTGGEGMSRSAVDAQGTPSSVKDAGGEGVSSTM